MSRFVDKRKGSWRSGRGTAGALVLGFLLMAGLALAQPGGQGQPSWDGLWRGWAVEGKGESQSARRMYVQLRIKGDQMEATQLRLSGEPLKDLGQGTFKLRKKGSIWEIDATRTQEPGRGQTYLGICSLEGKTLKWCSGNAGKARPREFESQPHQQYLLILNRQGP